MLPRMCVRVLARRGRREGERTSCVYHPACAIPVAVAAHVTQACVKFRERGRGPTHPPTASAHRMVTGKVCRTRKRESSRAHARSTWLPRIARVTTPRCQRRFVRQPQAGTHKRTRSQQPWHRHEIERARGRVCGQRCVRRARAESCAQVLFFELQALLLELNPLGLQLCVRAHAVLPVSAVHTTPCTLAHARTRAHTPPAIALPLSAGGHPVWNLGFGV